MNDDAIGEAAARWHAAQDMEDMDWPGFSAWLDADPRHREAFDQIALIDEAVGRHRETLRRLSAVIEPVEGGPVRRRWAAVGVGAAAVAAVVALTLLPRETQHPAVTPATEWRANGSARELRIADAGITLAPGSRLVAPQGDVSRLVLAGRAAFDVRHDPSRTLRISVAGFDIRDVGTRFEVIAGSDMVQVIVAEGEVEVRARGGTASGVRVVAGRTATGTADGRIVTAAAGGGPLAGWRSGPLVYDAAPLGLVAADLTRAAGKTVAVDASFAGRPFSGVLARSDAATMAANVAALTGLETRRQGETIRLGDRARR